ncbi:putative E3 ubiquitin-protein ligase-like, partial [Crotalus adamanteus]
MGRRSHKKGIKCPKCHDTQNASHKFCSNCGGQLTTSCSVQNRRDEEKTSVVEMEPDGDLRVQSSPLSGSLVNEQPSSEQMPGASEESLSGSLGKGTTASQKRKNRKRNKKTSPDSELHSSLSSLSSAPSSLDYSLTPDVANGDTDSRSSDLNVNVTSMEEKKSGSSTEYQNYGTKRFLPESEVKNSNSTEVMEEAKQQKSASNSKKAKVNAAQQKYVSEKGQKICTPVEESGGERRDSAAAGNQRPQRRNKASVEERNHEVPAVRQNHTPTENITVYFHAILSKDFKMNPEKHKVFILAGGISDYIDWKDHVCELNCTQDLGDHGYLIEGHTIISKENLDKEISYKYVVKRDKQLLYEFIYKPALEGFHVNRSLYLSSKLISGTDWHQYDDIICTKPEDSWWTTFKNQIPFRKDKEKDVVKGKCIAARIMLDSLFSILKTWSRINIKSFFQQFQQFYSVNKRIMLHEGCRKPWKELQFGEEQLQDLIMNYLMEQSSNILKQNTSMWDKLGLALITLTLVKDYNLQLSKKGLEQLCRFLCLENSPADVNETKCFREMFSECQGVEEKLIMLCNSCIEEKIHQWVWTLPVLYLFTVTDSECKIRTWNASEEKWARLEGIQYLGIRDQNRNFNRNLIMEKKHLLKGNQTLFRSWFCLLRLCDLVEFISGPYADPFDCLLGTFYRLKNLRIDSQNCQDVKKLLEKLLHILSEKKITIQQGDWKHSAVACEKLHEMCSHQVPAIPHYKLLATAVEIVSTVLALEPSEVSEMEFATTVYQSVRKTVSDWFHYCLPKPLLEKRSITFSWKEELEAWDHFLKIKFPNSSHSEDWKEALSTILKSRIKQEGAVEQIKVYCSHYEKIQKFNSVILQTFENCALEAIDSAYQKQQNLLELISKYDKNKLGKIISAAIIKSWPKDDAGTPLKDFQSILKHLFEWQDSRYLFVFNRAEENTLNQFTDEVRLLMTLAESSFQNAANELVTGHILIKDLELIIKYKTRFIKCTEQSLPNELLKGLKLEKVLDLRRQEVLHVKKEKKYLGVLLDMLRKIQCYLKVDLTEVEQKHSGNLSLKTLDAVVKYQDNGEWIDERIQQIQQYHELDLALDSAKVIDKVKEVLKLTGNFGVLQQLLNLTSEFQSFQEEKLSSMSSSLMDAKKLLQDITEKRRLCLEELALRKEFVNWVKEALEDKNELKVFVELASISAGENDMDVDRVACFHDAVFGYSSLLYDLKQEAGFVEFMKCLENVWKALESDHNLPEKLRDSARYLDWLKTIKESHGSVELSSISLATRINEKGIYRIKAPVEGQKVCLDTILDLTIQESHGDQEKIRQYSLEELQELMNKLMLMSGKEEQSAQVEKFSEVFSNIQRFALSFMNLYSAGNMLFRNWIANIYCSPESRNFIIHMTPLRPLKDIQSYLGKHYKTTELGNPSTSIFKNNMCVGIVSSERAGMGKSLYIKRLHQKMKEQLQGHRVLLRTIRLIDPHVNERKILNSLFLLLDQKSQKRPMILHFDITSSVQTGISEFLFKLFILRYLEDTDGKIWLRKQCHLYVAEILQPSPSPKKQRGSKSPGLNYSFLDVFPQHNINGSIDAINPLNGNIIKRNVMTPQLYTGLVLQKVPFNINFDALTRAQKIEKLCMVLGIEWPTDPDETYELTTDNILKMLAIEMRFRCGIPVVLMGETGCGKTRLIKYLCELRKIGVNADNMKLVKVHGGTTADAIYAKVREAEYMADYNKSNYQFDTILFFDEANTTEAVSCIKEVLCDHTIEGQPLLSGSGLQIIAACNPYRKHTPKMIQRLESAGLGYRVKAEDTSEKLGSIPLRQLVYRVHALPPSMIPLVWDFGQLNNITEKLYIEQIVQKLAKSIKMSANEIQMIIEVLFESQTYMRKQKDECSFISLRDVERCVEVFRWFHGHSERLIEHLEKYLENSCASVVLQVTENLKESLLPQQLRQKVQEQAQLVLLNCATPDSVVRLGDSKLDFLRENLAKIYFQQQQHTSFAEFLHGCLRSDSRGHTVFIEITTFSRLLTAADTEILEAELQHDSDSLKVLFLQQFDTEYSFLKDIRKFFAVRTDGSKILIIQTDFENGSLSAQLIASARYSTVNEVNKIQKNQARVFVIFITKLSRIEGGSSYIGFHGGLWQSVHIDDLRTCKDMVSDITSLRSITVSQLFSENMGESAENPETAGTEEKEEIEQEMEVEASPISKPEILSQVLDTTVLLRSCVQSAVGMLKDQNEEAGRSAKRIEILLSLLSEEGNFLKITKSRLTCLLKKQEENFFQVKEWVLREASNLTALQEGGTFRRTLWKRIQSMVTPFLAYMISILDRDYNLDLLVEPTTKNCVKALWLFIFNELKLLDIPYVMGQSSSQTKPIQVQNYMEVSTGAGNKMPFSWKIKDYLEDLRVHAQHITNNEAHAEKFLDIFQQTPLGQHIACYSEEEKAIFFHCYVRDFILLAMGVTSERELNMLQVALLSCVEEMKTASSDAGTRVPSLPWVHLGYHQFRSRLQNFSRILAVYPEVLHTLEQREKNRSCTLHSQMVLDVFAALACTEMLSSAVLTWKSRAWLQQVKDLQMPIELVCAANCSQGSGSQCSQMLQEVKSQWNRVFSVSLFVEHVLLGAETLIPELKELVKKYIVKLDK